MEYLHVEINTKQMSKKNNLVCGDIVQVHRDKISTVVVISDGLGSGIKANIAAQICVSRIIELIKEGFSIRHAFSTVTKTMEEAKKNDMPYAVFTIFRVLNDGITSILTYEMPPPIFITKKYSSVLKQKIITINDSVVAESTCVLNPGENILLYSDGIYQSGLGFKTGEWKADGIVKFINTFISNGNSIKVLSQEVLLEAKKRWDNLMRDDATIVLASARKGRIVNIFTGPPIDKRKDREVVEKFMSMPGIKIVCGASTAKIVARELNKDLSVSYDYESTVTPPKYEIDGLNLVTEGSITLNQLYNVWDEDESKLDKNNPVLDFKCLLNVADRVNIFTGLAENPADEDMSFKLTGILARKIIVPLIIKKLENEGKLVVYETF